MRRRLCLSTLLSTLVLGLPALAVVNTPIPASLPNHSFESSEIYDMHRASLSPHISHYLRAAEKAPTNLLALYHVGVGYFDLAKNAQNPVQRKILLELAQVRFERIQSLNPTFIEAYFKLGKIALMLGDFATAESVYKTALTIEPDNAALTYNLAEVLDEQNRLPEAIILYEKAIQLNPNFTFAHNNLGLLYEKQGRLDQAEHHYQKALAIDPTYNFARLNLGTLYLEQSRYPEAEALFQQALKQSPENPWAHFYLGHVWFRTNQLNQALAAYQKAIQLNPQYPAPYYCLALTLTRLQRVEEAFAAGAQYMAIDPTGAHVEEVKALIQQLHYQKAESAEP
jgi:tetratricopeptide (TPR) repeat protein